MQIDRLVNTCKWDEREPMTGAKQIQKKCNCALYKKLGIEMAMKTINLRPEKLQKQKI